MQTSPPICGSASQQDAVDYQAAILVTGQAVSAAAGFDLGDVLGEELVQQALGIRAPELQRELTGM